jgi:hypothetical protein
VCVLGVATMQVGSFEQYSEALERLVREGKQLQQQATPAPTAFGSVRRGATPSLAECQVLCVS